MLFELRDVAAAMEERDAQFKIDKGTIPCVTCDVSGVIADSGGNPLSALVEGEGDRIWVMAYNDSVPFAILNNGRVATQTGLMILVGYFEGSVEREVIGYNNNTVGVNVPVLSGSSSLTYVTRGMFPFLKVTPVTGLTISISSFEYYVHGNRYVLDEAISLSLSSYIPAASKTVYVLIYLSYLGVVSVVSGTPVQNIAGAKPLKPSVPLYGFASAYIRLYDTTTAISFVSIEEAKQVVRPNALPGLSYNIITNVMTIPPEHTFARGNLRIKSGGIVLQLNSRMVIS